MWGVVEGRLVDGGKQTPFLPICTLQPQTAPPNLLLNSHAVYWRRPVYNSAVCDPHCNGFMEIFGMELRRVMLALKYLAGIRRKKGHACSQIAGR